MKLLIKTLCVFVISFVFFISIVLLFEPSFLSVESAMSLYGIGALAAVSYMFLSRSLLTFGPLHIILLYEACSCFGYDIVVLLFGHGAFLEICAIRHAYIEYFNLANAICFCLLCSALLGARVSVKSSRNNFCEFQDAFSIKEKNILCLLCKVFVWTLCSVLLAAVMFGTLSFSTYSESREWFADRSYFGYLLRIVWVSVPTYLLLCKRISVKGFALPLAMVSFILIFTGNRNEAMYCLAMGLGSFVWRRKQEQGRGVPVWAVIASLFVVFVLNPIISSTRAIGLDFDTLITGAFGVKDALMELGQQINPFSISLYAMDKLGYGFQMGMTILVPSLVILLLRALFDSSDYLYSDYNPLYVLERMGHSGRGYSLFAELYVNFGTVISMGVVFLLSRFAARCEHISSRPRIVLLYFQISTLFMLWARNTIAFNITIVVFALIMDSIAYFAANTRSQEQWHGEHL